MSSSDVRKIDKNILKKEHLIDLKKSVDEDLDNIMKMIGDFKNDVDRKIDFLMNMIPEEKIEKITDGQIWYIKILYEKLGEKLPTNLDVMSKKEASKLIDELKKRLGW